MAIVFSIWRAQELAHAAPRERRSLWPCTASSVLCHRFPLSHAQLDDVHSARETRQLYRQPMVIIRVPLVLEASFELYSDACGYSQRYNERVEYVPV